MTGTRPAWLTDRSLVKNLGPAVGVVWTVSLVLGYTIGVTASGDINETVQLALEACIFVILVVRLVAATRVWPERGLALIALTVGILLWAVGSIVVNSAESPTTVSFPAPGEWFFLASYIGMAAFIVLDAGNRSGRAVSAWLDAAIACGAAAAIASIVLLTPFTRYFPEGGVSLLVALIYPVIDLTLAVLVIGQVALGSRTWSRSTVGLVIGFVLFAVADSSLVLNLGSNPYAFTVALVLMWGLALILIVGAACSERPPLASMSRRLSPYFLVASFLISVLLLLLRPSGLVGAAVALPAVATLLATAGRMVIALRESLAASEAFRLARTDDLTGLPNRRAALRAIDVALAGDEGFALMLLDLDGFKEVNDTLGHSAGDTLLELVAMRVRNSLPSQVILARVGGDEFAILVKEVDEIELLERAHGIRRTLLAPARIDDLDLGMSASLGIAVRQEGDMRAADLLRRADVAMYEAKVNRTGVELYRADHDEFSRFRLRMGEELRRALRSDQIVVWFQPKVDRKGSVVGLESLVRWEKPDGEVLAPAAFLPVARRAGLMAELSEVVVHGAITMAARWHRMGLDLHVAINIAPPELLAGQLLPVVYRNLRAARLPAHLITIEVTEDSFLADPERAREVLLDVSAHGLRISIDDYGTGFSSLAYLRNLPVDELKMDRSFISTMCVDERSRLIVASTVDMAHALDLLVVAEGVEDARVAAESLALGVDLMQGYYFAQPMRGGEVEGLVRGTTPPPVPIHAVPTEETPQDSGKLPQNATPRRG